MERRSLLVGLGIGGLAGAGLMLPFRAALFSGSAPATGGGGDLADFFANTGATTPWYGNSTYPPALHDSGSNTSWFAWEGFRDATRVVKVTSLDHDTGYFGDITEAGFVSMVDDDHGNPAIALDHEGYLHAFYGSHGNVTASDSRHSSTRWAVTGSPGVGSLWSVRESFGAGHTYPKPVRVGTKLYVFFRKTVGSDSSKFVLFETSALSAGVPTWAAEKEVIDFGGTNRFYAGNFHVVGTDIHFVATLGDSGDTKREHLYYFVYRTATGALENHDGSTSIASGSLPASLATFNSNFRLFTHTSGNDDGGIPVLCFDTSGDPHVLFKDGTGTSYAIKHIKRTTGTWGSPVTVATVDNRFVGPALVPLAVGAVEAWYTLDPGAAWTRGGNMARRERASGGTWGAEQTVLVAGTKALDRPSMVLSGHANARVVFTEIAADSLDASAGGLRAYTYGASGLVPYAAEPASTPTSGETLQLNGENLILNTEDLTLGT